VKIVIDSCAWIELFNGSKNGEAVKQILEKADQLYTPDIVLTEVARKYIRDGVEGSVVISRLEQISTNSKITYIDNEIALESAKCQIELANIARNNRLNSPSLFDAIILATSRLLESKVLTGDAHFKSLSDTIWI
jgi:predicted nucleic acid-binding protein